MENYKNRALLTKIQAKIKTNHISNPIEQIDAMDERDVPKMTQLTNVIEVKKKLEVSEDMQGIGSTNKHLHNEENSNTRATRHTNDLEANRDMVDRATHKQKITSKWNQPQKSPYLVDLTRSKNLQGATTLGFQTLIAHD